MFLRNLRFYLSETALNFSRNRHATVITVLQTFVSLFVLGLFLIIIINANRFVTGFLNSLQVAVFLDDSLSKEETQALYHTIRDETAGITKVEYISKAEAWKWMEGETPFELGDLVERNPLPASFKLHIASSRYAPIVAAEIDKLDGILEIRYPEETLGQYLPIFYFILGASFILAMVLAGATVFTISNTIRLAIYARRKEIKIMQLVGATDWTIRGPFLIEGLIYGIVGSLFAFAFVSIGYNLLFSTFTRMVVFRPIFVTSGEMAYNLFVLMVTLGIIIGVAGSLIAVDRYLESEYSSRVPADGAAA